MEDRKAAEQRREDRKDPSADETDKRAPPARGEGPQPYRFDDWASI